MSNCSESINNLKCFLTTINFPLADFPHLDRIDFDQIVELLVAIEKPQGPEGYYYYGRWTIDLLRQRAAALISGLETNKVPGTPFIPIDPGPVRITIGITVPENTLLGDLQYFRETITQAWIKDRDLFSDCQAVRDRRGRPAYIAIDRTRKSAEDHNEKRPAPLFILPEVIVTSKHGRILNHKDVIPFTPEEVGCALTQLLIDTDKIELEHMARYNIEMLRYSAHWQLYNRRVERVHGPHPSRLPWGPNKVFSMLRRPEPSVRSSLFGLAAGISAEQRVRGYA